MIEVFKTNINCKDQARQLIEDIQAYFSGYKANFDLEDRDRILRIVTNEVIEVRFIDWLKEAGCYAEILPDN